LSTLLRAQSCEDVDDAWDAQILEGSDFIHPAVLLFLTLLALPDAWLRLNSTTSLIQCTSNVALGSRK
jgi:hypothetical protein